MIHRPLSVPITNGGAPASRGPPKSARWHTDFGFVPRLDATNGHGHPSRSLVLRAVLLGVFLLTSNLPITRAAYFQSYDLLLYLHKSSGGSQRDSTHTHWLSGGSRVIHRTLFVIPVGDEPRSRPHYSAGELSGLSKVPEVTSRLRSKTVSTSAQYTVCFVNFCKGFEL